MKPYLCLYTGNLSESSVNFNGMVRVLHDVRSGSPSIDQLPTRVSLIHVDDKIVTGELNVQSSRARRRTFSNRSQRCRNRYRLCRLDTESESCAAELSA